MWDFLFVWLKIRDEGSSSAIHSAVINDDIDEVRRLLAADPACIGARDDIVRLDSRQGQQSDNIGQHTVTCRCG